MKETNGTLIIFFDGVCNLCNGLVDFLIKRDHNRSFRYASLQSAHGEEILNQLSIPSSQSLSTVIVLEGDNPLIKSEAVKSIFHRLGGGWKILSYIISIFPRSICDWVYDRVAASRYSLMGKRSECRVPSPDEADLFL